VRAAVESGALDTERLESFHKLGLEEKFVSREKDAAVRAEQTKAFETINEEAEPVSIATAGVDCRSWKRRCGRIESEIPFRQGRNLRSLRCLRRQVGMTASS